MVRAYFWLAIGLFLIIAGVWLMFDFLLEFAKLVVGLLFVVIGLQFVGASRQQKVRVR